MSKLAVYSLLYGPHADLHARLLSGLEEAVGKGWPVRLWANQVGGESKNLLAGWPRVVYSDANTPKCQAMRQMMLERAGKDEWLLELDDDVAFRPGWCERLKSEFLDKPTSRLAGLRAEAAVDNIGPHYRRWAASRPWCGAEDHGPGPATA